MDLGGRDDWGEVGELAEGGSHGGGVGVGDLLFDGFGAPCWETVSIDFALITQVI